MSKRKVSLGLIIIAAAALTAACLAGQTPTPKAAATPGGDFTIPIIVLTPTASIEEAAAEVAKAINSFDYRDRAGWEAGVKAVSTDEGWALWSGRAPWSANNLDEWWARVEAEQRVVAKVEARDVKVLKTWARGRTYVEVTLHVEGSTKDGPFSEEVTSWYVLAPYEGQWRHDGPMPVFGLEQPTPPAKVTVTPGRPASLVPTPAVPVEEAAAEVAKTMSTFDYRDRAGWEARVKAVCTDEGWAFKAHLLDKWWPDTEAEQERVTEVEVGDVEVLETWASGRTYVRMRIRIKGHNKSGPFSREYADRFVLAPYEGEWRYDGPTPAVEIRLD